jgi:alpha-tubulin suppressor-like RCC1 family protein
MGLNSYGQLGDGTSNNTNKPEQIVSSGVAAIAAGNSHSLFLKSDGSLWAMGRNNSGQLGDGTLNNTNKPERIVTNGVVAIAAGYAHSLFLKTDGSPWSTGSVSNSWFPAPVTDFVGSWVQATCRFGGTYLLLTGTNITQPLNQWTPVWTNSVTTRGTNNFTAMLSKVLIPRAPQQFYILQSQ